MWYYNDEVFEEIGDYIGFVYRITNLTNNKKYIGKKNFYFSRTKTIKGKKKRSKVESDWRDYYGSNKELNADVALHGEGNFRRDILRLCKSKAEFGYYEAKYQEALMQLKRLGDGLERGDAYRSVQTKLPYSQL